jgi:prepilin-type N-terminal cleavage/methylation domain-containing protein
MMSLRRPPRSRGYTLVEVLIAMTLTGIVVAGMLKALTAQKKFYARQSRILDARHAMRASATILASELRELSASGGDIYALAPDSIALRSTVAFGIVCNVDLAGGRLSLTHTTGHFRLEGEDSVLVFVEGSSVFDDDSWRTLPATGITMFGPSCSSGRAPDRVVSLSGNLSGVTVGSPVRIFRPYIYGLFQLNDRWWLGRRGRAAGSSYVPVAGPLAPPADQGLVLTYQDSLGVPTADRSEVARVEIKIRAPTYRSLTDPDYRELLTSAFLRNDG